MGGLSLARAGRLLLVAALSRAGFQLGHDFGQGDPPRLKNDEQMIQYVGRLGAHRPLVLGRRGDGELDRLLAKLARAMSRALVEEAAGIGLLRARGRASSDGFGEVVEREHGEQSPTSLSGRRVERTKAKKEFRRGSRRWLSARDSRRCRTRRTHARCRTA